MADRYWYCGVAVKGAKTNYSYISDAGELPLGSYVMVPFGSQNALRIGVVQSCGEYAAEDAPYPVGQTKHIVREATAEEYENQPPIPPFYDGDDLGEDLGDDLEDDLNAVNCSIAQEDWDEVFGWACDNQDYPEEAISRKVIECYELCAQHDIPEAALNLGTFYYTGRVVGQDYQKAYELYKTAADAGVLRAICNCGYCFYYGRHQEVDYEKAYEYFSLGALLYDDANCLYKLGDLYLNGYGVAKNERYAFILYQRALQRSWENDADAVCAADAQFRVGKCYLAGIGTEQNPEKAYDLLSLSLINFYKCRKTDHFVIGSIQSAKELLAQAQEQLERETSDYQRQPDDSYDAVQT